MSYAQSQLNRQAILDHLHQHPLKSAQQISNESGVGRNSVESCVRMMTARGEIEKIGAGATTRYKAIATTTVSAETIIAETKVKRSKAGVKAAQIEYGRVTSPGYYKQCGGTWKAQSASGGQGAVRVRVYVGSSSGML
jgi:hypothetical protein